MWRLSSFIHDRRGNFALIAGLVAVPVLGLAGAAVDYSRAADLRTRLQATLDAALLNGAKQAAGSRVSAAKTAFSDNWIAPQGVIATSSFSEPSQTVFSGTASANVPTTVTRLLGLSTIAIGAKGSVNIPAAALPCILLLDPSASQSLLVNSGANVQAPNCEVHVASTGNPAAVFNSGSTINSAKLCVKGNNVTKNGGTYPNLTLGCPTAADPYAALLPTPSSTSCTYNNLNYGTATVNLSPGVYCGWFNFNNAPTVNFAPGLYVIKGGGWNVNGGVWNGTGVTFYFADTSVIQFNSAVKATLSAPTTGTWMNFLFAEAKGLSKTSFILNDSNGQNFTGVVYLPTKNMTVNSASTVSAEGVTMVFNTLILNSVTWNVKGNSSSGGSGTTPVLSQ